MLDNLCFFPTKCCLFHNFICLCLNNMVFINHVLKFKYPLDSTLYVQKITTDKNVVKFSIFLRHVSTYFIGHQQAVV